MSGAGINLFHMTADNVFRVGRKRLLLVNIAETLVLPLKVP